MLPFCDQFCLGKRTGLLKDLINIYKYKSVRACAETFAYLLREKYGLFLEGKIIVPLPTISKHIRERGFDHMEFLAKRIAYVCGGKCEKVLKRVGNTVQVGADEMARKKQALGAYSVTNRVNFDAQYVLIDDVWTTGSSMMAACSELQKARVEKISVVLLAKSE